MVSVLEYLSNFVVMLKSNINIIVSFSGEQFNHTEFTDIIRVDPTRINIKGVSKKYSMAGVYDVNEWIYETGSTRTYLLSELTDELYDLFEPTINDISSYLSDKKVVAKIFIVVNVVNEEKPALYLNANFVNLLSKLRIEVDFDIYNYEDNTPESSLIDKFSDLFKNPSSVAIVDTSGSSKGFLFDIKKNAYIIIEASSEDSEQIREILISKGSRHISDVKELNLRYPYNRMMVWDTDQNRFISVDKSQYFKNKE